jgi:hypothetical protein
VEEKKHGFSFKKSEAWIKIAVESEGRTPVGSTKRREEKNSFRNLREMSNASEQGWEREKYRKTERRERGRELGERRREVEKKREPVD